MSYTEAMAQGFANLFAFPNIFIPILGTLVAMVASFLPGIGGSSVAALLIVLTITWDPIHVLLLFGAITGGATFMGSVTAILFNIPGNSAAAAALLDGHAMTRKGLPKTALACAATASALGSLVGVAVLLALLPVVRPFILEFGPLERLLLGIWGLSTIIAVPNTSAAKALGATLLGLMVAAIGSDPASAEPRWTFGFLGLYGGVDLIAMLLGFFTLTEIMGWRRNYTLAAAPDMKGPRDSVLAGIIAVFRHYGLMIRSSIIGTVVGIIPGVGGTVAGFVAYGQAIQTAKERREDFGKGDIRGLIAPESAVDAKDGGSLLPALAFGLPGSEAGVILVTVFAIHGIVPGLPMLTTELHLTFTLIIALLLSNILTSVVGVAAAPGLARLTHLPIDRVALPVLILGLLTIVQLNGVLADLHLAILFGVFGYLLKHFDWPRVPFIIAFVLGGFIETNLALTVRLTELGRIDIAEQPVAIAIVLFIAVSFWWMARRKRIRASDDGTRPHAALFAGFLATAGAVFLVDALTAPGAHSLYTIAVASGALAVCLRVVAAEIRRARAGRSVAAGDGPFGLPAAHVVPVVAIGAVPALTLLFGLSPAMAGMSAIWLLGTPGLTGRAKVARLAVAAAIGAG
ncbi:MAG: tripartite tricarboxylate transporter permease, partial [Rubricella sp.]